MIRVLMLDLGDTLVWESSPLPHCQKALTTLSGFETGSGEPLLLCLVSDFLMPETPGDLDEINGIFRRYLECLEGVGLRGFFEPVEEKVTLSTHAGVHKPDRKVFEVALRRLGTDAGLDKCLFVTENGEHIRACKDMGMATLRFGPQGEEGVDFSNWLDVPLLVAGLLSSGSDAHMQSALRSKLTYGYDATVVSIEKDERGRCFWARAKVPCEIEDPNLRDLDGVYVDLPVTFSVELDDAGGIRSLKQASPTSEDISEAKQFLLSLAASGQVSSETGAPGPGVTHQVVVDDQGRRRLIRKRFSSI